MNVHACTRGCASQVYIHGGPHKCMRAHAAGTGCPSGRSCLVAWTSSSCPPQLPSSTTPSESAKKVAVAAQAKADEKANIVAAIDAKQVALEKALK